MPRAEKVGLGVHVGIKSSKDATDDKPATAQGCLYDSNSC